MLYIQTFKRIITEWHPSVAEGSFWALYLELNGKFLFPIKKIKSHKSQLEWLLPSRLVTNLSKRRYIEIYFQLGRILKYLQDHKQTFDVSIIIGAEKKNIIHKMRVTESRTILANFQYFKQASLLSSLLRASVSYISQPKSFSWRKEWIKR